MAWRFTGPREVNEKLLEEELRACDALDKQVIVEQRRREVPRADDCVLGVFAVFSVFSGRFRSVEYAFRVF